MEKNWVKVFSSTLPHQVEIAKAVLADSGIESVVLNKQDSMYRVLDFSIPVELLVKYRDALKAKHLIDSNSQ